MGGLMMMATASGKVNYSLAEGGELVAQNDTFSRKYPDSQDNPYPDLMKQVVLNHLFVRLIYGEKGRDFDHSSGELKRVFISFFTFEHVGDAPWEFVLRTVGKEGEDHTKYLTKTKCELVFVRTDCPGIEKPDFLWIPDEADPEEKKYFRLHGPKWLKKGTKYREQMEHQKIKNEEWKETCRIKYEKRIQKEAEKTKKQEEKAQKQNK